MPDASAPSKTPGSVVLELQHIRQTFDGPAGEPVVVDCRVLRRFKLGLCHERVAPFSGQPDRDGSCCARARAVLPVRALRSPRDRL